MQRPNTPAEKQGKAEWTQKPLIRSGTRNKAQASEEWDTGQSSGKETGTPDAKAAGN